MNWVLLVIIMTITQNHAVAVASNAILMENEKTCIESKNTIEEYVMNSNLKIKAICFKNKN